MAPTTELGDSVSALVSIYQQRRWTLHHAEPSPVLQLLKKNVILNMNTQPNPTLRIAIIGGGAAGYFAAIEAKRTPSLAASTCKPHGAWAMLWGKIL